MEYLGLGAEITVSLAAPMIAGYYVDRYFDISPAGILSGILLGLVLFIMMMLRLARDLNSEDDIE